MGLTVEQTLPDTSNRPQETEALLPDPKFRTNPAKAEWKPDLAVPAGFKEAVWGTAEGA